MGVKMVVWRLPWDSKLDLFWGALDRVNKRLGLLTETGLYLVDELSKPIVHLFG
jgi:hypothetical protein